MKFKVNDQVIITAGKDKGVKSVITQVFPKENKVIVKDANFYVKHVKPIPMMNRPGERTRQERPIGLGNIAILNDKGEPDRIGYKISEDGKKQRIFKKTGKLINYKKAEASAKSSKSAKKTGNKKKKTSQDK
jgi:large subunit ribosomal protein L24